MKRYDIIIVGSGAGGGTLAAKLARSGKGILILERGDWLPREPQNWSPHAVFSENRYVSPDTWLDANENPFQPQSHYFVGGATKLYGAALFRFRPQDFASFWPIQYETLAPYYDEAERMYHVTTLPHEPKIQALADGLKSVGLNPWRAPSAVFWHKDSHPSDNDCIRCSTCDGHPCLVQGKADAEMCGIRPALRDRNVELRTNAEVIRVLQRNRRVWGVQLDNGETIGADTIVLAAGAVNTAKLWMASGLPNGSDQVGRNYMFHISQVLLAMKLSKHNDTVFQKTLAISDWEEEGLGFIQMLGKATPEMFGGKLPHMMAKPIVRRSMDFWLMTEDFPDPDNRVTLVDGKPQITYRPNNANNAFRLRLRFKSKLREIGYYQFLHQHIPIAGCAHQAGTCRMGNDPTTSVVDTNCKAHEVDGLYVVDASVLPSVGARNPSLTIIANALRVGDHLNDD